MLFTRRDIVKIVFPLIIEQFLSVTIGMFDSMMVSRAGETAISGVSLVDTVNLLLVYLFSALATGGAVVVSQYLGKKDHAKTVNAAKQLVMIILFMSSAVAIATVFLRVPLLRLIFGSVEEEVMYHAKGYFLVTAASYPFLGLYSAGAAIFRSMGNSKISMTTSMIMNTVNISFNALFIFVFKWAAVGAGAATLLARIVGAAIMMILLRNPKNAVHIRHLHKTRPEWPLIKEICRIGIPSGIENSMFQFGKVITQSVVASCGTVHIAANAVANSLSQLEYIPGSAVGIAVITVVGRCIGAGELEQARSNSRKMLGMSYIAIWSASAVMLLALEPILKIYDLSPDSTSLARTLMLLHTLFVCTIWPMSFTTPHSFRSAGDVRFPLVISVLSMWICRVGLSYVFGKFLGLGVTGVWLAMFSDWACRGSIYAVHLLKGTWLKKYRSVSQTNKR